MKSGQFLVADSELGERLDLSTNLVQVGGQVFPGAAAKSPFHFGVGVVVQHSLHHRQLVIVRVQQALNDTVGKYAGAH
jgi:hypothetical protein